MEKFAPLPPPKLGIEVLQTAKNPEDEVYESGKFSLNFVPRLILPKRKGPGIKVGKFHNLKMSVSKSRGSRVESIGRESRVKVESRE